MSTFTYSTVVGKIRRGAGVGMGDQWVKPGDWELGDHVTDLCFNYKLGESLLEFENGFSFSRCLQWWDFLIVS